MICHAQGTTAPALLDTTIAAGEADAQAPVPRGLAKYNHWDLGPTTLRIGYGFLVDFATYYQDHDAKQQVVPEADIGLRDFRFILKGKFKTERPFSWTAGIMYDGPTKEWHFRQTGLMFDVPEISSSFFIGRTKEGYSQYKVMVGYDIWTIERSPFLDAFVPILGDGIKWTVHVPKRHFLANLGWFSDALSEEEKFATYDNQFVGRVAWVPVVSERGKLVHLALMGRVGDPDGDKFQARGRPEMYLAPYFVDTGRVMAVRGGIRLADVRCPGERGPHVPRRQRIGRLAHHRRDAGLQPGQRLLQGSLAPKDGVRRRTGSGGSHFEPLVHRPGRRQSARRQVLEADADREVAPDGLSASGARVRLRCSRSLRPQGNDALLPGTGSDGTLIPVQNAGTRRGARPATGPALTM
jgi:hypothetical protein